MKTMILSAGRGERMRPLTDTIPKPLLEVNGKPLIIWHIEKLAKSGFKEIIINVAHLGYKIIEALGDGSKWGVRIVYSDEQNEGALESAGGIVKALALLGSEPFLVVNADIWTDFNFNASFNLGDDLAHLVLVKNPEHNLGGDFGFVSNRVLSDADEKYTFSGIGYYKPQIFKHLNYGKSALAPVLRDLMRQNVVSGELLSGSWIDVGTPKRLEEINKNIF